MALEKLRKALEERKTIILKEPLIKMIGGGSHSLIAETWDDFKSAVMNYGAEEVTVYFDPSEGKVKFSTRLRDGLHLTYDVGVGVLYHVYGFDIKFDEALKEWVEAQIPGARVRLGP